jgi:hypothetical protein
MLEQAGLEVLDSRMLIHNPRLISTILFLALRRLLGRRADGPIAFLLHAFAALERLPTREFTGCFSAVRARKPSGNGGAAMNCARRNLLPAAGALVVFYTAAVMMQFASGAYRSEFGAHPDEPSHVVTSLLVRDYLAGGFPQSPMRFAESYYAHYPKVALGHWPPVYYVLQAAWNVVFSPTRASILACHALFTALLASLLFHWAHRRFGSLIALAAGFWLLSVPLIQWLNSTVMLDIAVALFVLAAALAYGDYLHAPGWRPAVWFGAWASLAILTKGTGVLLAFLPIVCLVLARRGKLVARLSFWLPAFLVAVACGPWYLLSPEALQQRSGFLGAPSFDPVGVWSMFWTWAGRMGVPSWSSPGSASPRTGARSGSKPATTPGGCPGSRVRARR